MKKVAHAQLCLTLCDPMDSTRLLCPWNFLGNNTEVGCHFLLQGIFLTQGLKLSVSYNAGGFCAAKPPGKP